MSEEKAKYDPALKKLLRQVIRFADRQGKWVEPGYSVWDDKSTKYEARGHTNWHAGGHSYFATVSTKEPGKGKRWKVVFKGVWYSYTDNVVISKNEDGPWKQRVETIPVED